jgi:hypothetical protein
MTLWMGVFSLFPQTQAFSCWWNCCCCCHQEEPKTLAHKQPLMGQDQRSDQPSSYGTNSQTASLAHKPQQKLISDSRSPIAERRNDSTVVSLLPSAQQASKQEEPLLQQSASLVTISLTPSYHLEWAAGTFNSTSCRKIWTVANQTDGDTIFGDEELPLALDDLVKVVFPQIPRQTWEVHALDKRPACQKLLYKKAVHYALQTVQVDAHRFVTAIESLWEENPKALAFAHFQFRLSKESARHWYFFATKGSRVLYFRTPYIEGKNDQRTGSQSVSRAVSKAPTRRSSPERTKDSAEKKEVVKKDKKSTTGSDSDE